MKGVARIVEKCCQCGSVASANTNNQWRKMFSVLKIDVEAQDQKTSRNEDLVLKRTFYGYRLHEESSANTQGSAMLFAFVFVKSGRRADVIIAPHIGILLALFSLVAISFAICIGRMNDALCWIFFFGGSVLFTAYMLHFIRKEVYYAYDKTEKRYIGNLNAMIPFAVKERKTYGWVGITLLLCCEYAWALLMRREPLLAVREEEKDKIQTDVTGEVGVDTRRGD